MRRFATVAFGLCMLMLLAAPRAFGQQEKLAQTGMKFLNVSVDPRAAGLGDAMTSVEGGATMLFYNPAGMARQAAFFNVAVGQTEWIADINYNFGSMAFRPAGGRLGVFGISYVVVDFGQLEETIRADNEQGFLDLGTFSPAAWSLGFGYAKALTDRFSVGAQVKWASQDLGDSVVGSSGAGSFERTGNKEGVLAFDFGVLYKTGFRSLNFAVAARNFAQEITYQEESFQLPLTLKIGLSMDLMDLTSAQGDMHSLLVSVDAENPRDFSEQIKIGAEYTFLQTFSLRVGYVFPTDEQGINLGLGLQRTVRDFSFGADYAYTDFGVFSSVHRLALRIAL